MAENLVAWRTTLVDTSGLDRGDKVDVLLFPECAFSRYFYAGRADLTVGAFNS